jgi:hypothetical protein
MELAVPVVHRVVLGGSAESSPPLLERVRLASAEKTPAAEKAPAPESGGQGSAGFTELLRTLSDETPASAAAKERPAAEKAPAAQDSGFTSLLQTLHSPDAAAAPAVEPLQAAQPAIQEEPRPSPAPAKPGGFTELLQAASGEDSGASGRPMHSAGPADAPFFGVAAGAVPAPIASQPGRFTQLFSALEEPGTSPLPAVPGGPETGDFPRRDKASFTQMLSLEEPPTPAQPSYAEPAFREARPPAPGSLDYGLAPETAAPAAAHRDPFSPFSPSGAQPAPDALQGTLQGTPPGSGVGITRLIRMLDEPSAYTPPQAVAPASAPPGAEPGVWTQTFASLAEPDKPAAPSATAPDWPPLPEAGRAAAAPAGHEARLPGSLNEFPAYAPGAAAATAPGAAPGAVPSASGPSEFTRILDASRLREQSMKAAPAQSAPVAPPAPPMGAPGYPAAVLPQVVGVPGYGSLPQPGLHASVQPPQMGGGGAVNFNASAGPMQLSGGMQPLATPHLQATAPPLLPPAPLAPPAPVPPALGKLQQYVPLLLVLIIVLLVALLVTVIFLMKH